MKAIKMKIGNKYIPSRSTYDKAAGVQIKRLGLADSERDAFTHAFSLALAARDWGEHAATIMGNVNEIIRPKNPSDEWFMDRHNNTLGVQTGKNKSSDISDDIIADEIKQRLDRGQLIIRPQETGLPHEAKGNPTGGKESEILKYAAARMRNTGRGLPPNTPVSAEPQSTEQLMQEERMKFPLDSSRRREAVKKMKLFGRDDGNK